MRSKFEIVGVRLVQILLFTLSLWVVEIVISGPMFLIAETIKNPPRLEISAISSWIVTLYKDISLYGLGKLFLDIFSLNYFRLWFYYPFYLPLFTLAIYMRALPPMEDRLISPLRERILSKKRVLKVGILNSSLYILLSLLYGFILMPWTYEYFSTALFPVWIISTFLSPFVLCKIPFYKRVLLSLLDRTNSWRVGRSESANVAQPIVEEIQPTVDGADIPSEDLSSTKKRINTAFVWKYIIFTLSLFVVEVFIFTAESMFFVHKHRFHFQDMWDMVLFCLHFSATKFVFYFSIQIVPFICLMSKIDGERRVLKIAALNGGLYILISLLHAFVLKPDTKIYFSQGFFYIFILATFISPFVLDRIPYYRKLSTELQKPNAPNMFKLILNAIMNPA